MKPKKCRQCRETFTPTRPIQPCCSYQCEVDWATERDRKIKAKVLTERRKDTKQRKEALKSHTDLANEMQAAYNKWRRLYLLSLGHGCISCGTHNPRQFHAGHFRTVKSAKQLRYTDDNVWLQCPRCNNHESGNILAYEKNLIVLIGQERVDAIKNNNEFARYTDEFYRAGKKHYSKLARELEKKNG